MFRINLISILITLFLVNTFAEIKDSDIVVTMLALNTSNKLSYTGYDDFSDSRLARWDDLHLNSGISLNSINVGTLPFSLYNNLSTTIQQFEEAKSAWNSQGSLQLENSTDSYGINFEFTTNEALFGPFAASAAAVTILPVELDFFEGKYYLQEYSLLNEATEPFTDEFYFQGKVVFNDSFEYTAGWTNNVNGEFGATIFKTVLLHELGHVLGMGHCYYFINGVEQPMIMRPNYNPSTFYPSLSEGDILSWNKVSTNLYGIVTGIGDGISFENCPSEFNPINNNIVSGIFTKGDPYITNFVTSWNISVNLFHESGTYELYKKTISGIDYHYSVNDNISNWTIPTNYSWTISRNGYISAEVILTAYLLDGHTLVIKKLVEFNYLTAPQNLLVTISNNTPELTWSANPQPDLASYRILRSIVPLNQNPSRYTLAATVSKNTTTWSDINYYVTGSGSYKIYYKVLATDLDGNNSPFSNEVWVHWDRDLQKYNNSEITFDYSLLENYPNPFNPSTNISFTLKEECKVSIIIYNILGREIVTLVDEVKSKGKHNVTFNAENLSSGIYFVKMEANEFSGLNKIVLMK